MFLVIHTGLSGSTRLPELVCFWKLFIAHLGQVYSGVEGRIQTEDPKYVYCEAFTCAA
jgi:hypothetical protein